jgi:hypothetical protein
LGSRRSGLEPGEQARVISSGAVKPPNHGVNSHPDSEEIHRLCHN